METQKEVRKAIFDRFPELKKRRNLNWLTLSLHTEIGEMANEWRGFKMWSNDRSPRVPEMLEEYVDCLSFILEIGLELNIQSLDISEAIIERLRSGETIDIFNELFYYTAQLNISKNVYWYNTTIECLIALGRNLGLSWEEIEAAYYKKNKINIERQENGY